MKKYIYPLQLITFFFFQFSNTGAQVIADFTVSPQDGCSPLVAHFDASGSSGPGTLTYLWYLGPQQGTSTLQKPNATYITPGIYTIKLVVTNGSETDSITKNVVAYKNPVANFSGERKGCTPHEVQFTDLSIPGDGQIISWDWDFRTGEIISEQNPVHTYTLPGKFDVFLEVTDVHGCKGHLDVPQYIDVVTPPVPNFTFAPSTACTVPAGFQFTNTTTGQGVLSYQWTFGDNQSSAETNPSHTYNSFDDYTVRLVVSNDYGCPMDTSKTVYVSQVNASGTISQGGTPITNNGIICPGRVDFNSTSTGTGFVRWIFGDGTSSVSKSGFHNYTQTGPIILKLIASPNNPCADTVTWNFTIENISANFTMNTDYSCTSPALVQFTDQSVNAASWEWTFSDSQKAYTQNTSHTYTVPYDPDPYKVNDNVYFSTTLEATSSHGCTSAVSKTFRIKKPTAVMTADKTSGCFPLQVRFRDQSLSDEPITTRQWIFGDTQTSSGAADSAIHIYNSHDTFNARLVITNNAGCKDTSYIIPIHAGKTLFPDFTISSNDVCPNQLITFTNTTPESNLIQGWHYYVNGTPVNALPGQANPVWKVKADTGYMDVKLQVNYNGCISETVKTDAIHNKGPVSAFSYNFSCGTPLQYSFTNQSVGYSSYKWVFGTNRTNTTTLNPNYTYSAEGDSIVELITYAGGCSDTAREELLIRNVQAIATGKSEVCAQDPVFYSGDQSYTIVNYCEEKYLWYISDSTQPLRTNNDDITHTFSSRGNFDVTLVVNYDNGCPDTADLSIRSYMPYTGFDADTLYGCTPFIVTFTDNSTADINPLETWHWVYEPSADTTYTSQAPFVKRWFNNPGVYEVTLTVTDTMGCAGFDVTTVSTANPDAEFLVSDDNTCLGNAVLFYYTIQEKDSVIWDFGNGDVSRDLSRPVSYTYPAEGEYTPMFTIYRFGCSDTFSMNTNQMKVQKASAYFDVSDSIWNCYPREDTLTHVKGGQEIVSGIWNFGYGNNTSSYAETRIFTYPKPGVYTPSLSIRTSFGCRDTFSRNITLFGPTGSFSMSPDAACRNDEITFALIDTSDVWYFEWDMGDGNTLHGNPVTYSYANMGAVYPKLVLQSDSGSCVVGLVDTLTIYVVQSDFIIPDTGMCATYSISFANTSQGNDFNNWSFSNGVFSTFEEPILVFTPGDYTGELIVRNTFGCSDTTGKPFTIYPLPVIAIKADTFMCAGNGVTLWATGGDNIIWMPSSGLSSNTIYSPFASPDMSTTYTATVSDAISGCKSSDHLFLLVQQPPALSVYPQDTGIYIGEIVPVRTDSLGELLYTWSPDYMINCIHCAAPQLQPLLNTTYTMDVADTNNCFDASYYIAVVVTEAYNVALPTAFTPMSSDENSVVYVRGPGIKRLIEFRIFNRWGTQVFYTDDIRQGWDGTYKGKMQNIDTYTYVVTAEFWDGRIVSTKGTITLLR